MFYLKFYQLFLKRSVIFTEKKNKTIISRIKQSFISIIYMYIKTRHAVQYIYK
jgi:hypothetical protein